MCVCVCVCVWRGLEYTYDWPMYLTREVVETQAAESVTELYLFCG